MAFGSHYFGGAYFGKGPGLLTVLVARVYKAVGFYAARFAAVGFGLRRHKGVGTGD